MHFLLEYWVRAWSGNPVLFEPLLINHLEQTTMNKAYRPKILRFIRCFSISHEASGFRSFLSRKLFVLKHLSWMEMTKLVHKLVK